MRSLVENLLRILWSIRPRLHRTTVQDPGRNATQATMWPRLRKTQAARDPGPLWDFFFFFFFFLVFLGMARWETWELKFFWFIDRVLETRFLGVHHKKKMSHQRWSDHENRVFETRDVSKKYSLKTVPTNYIIWQTVLISYFGHKQVG